jgi:MFS family permease
MPVLSLHLLPKPNKENVVSGIAWPAAARALRAANLAIAAAMASNKLRGKALGIQAVVRAIGLFAGPTVGSRIIDTFDWRWMFWVNMPIGIMGTIIAWFIVVETNAARLGSLDIMGPCADFSLGENCRAMQFSITTSSSRLF